MTTPTRGSGKPKWHLPCPQPTTPALGDVVLFSFQDYVAARLGQPVHPAVKKLYRTYGAYRCKPKRTSKGIVYQNTAYWWTVKGYYRNGQAHGDRRPLHHIIWENANHRKIPKKFEVFFTNRNCHDFRPENLELLSKADCHKRIHALGETRPATHEALCRGRQKMWTRKSRERVGLLLKQFNDPSASINFLAKRKQTINHGPEQ